MASIFSPLAGTFDFSLNNVKHPDMRSEYREIVRDYQVAIFAKKMECRPVKTSARRSLLPISN